MPISTIRKAVITHLAADKIYMLKKWVTLKLAGVWSYKKVVIHSWKNHEWLTSNSRWWV